MSRVEPPTTVQALDIAENGDVVATWLDRGVQKTCEVPAENVIEFLTWQSDAKRASWSPERRQRHQERVARAS